MIATHEIRKGAKVSGGHGKRLGVVEAVRTDDASGVPTGFVVKTGIWPLTKLKLLSVDVIRQVNNDPNTIIVNVSKKDLRSAPEVDG